MIEHLFDIDDFNKPKSLEGVDCDSQLLFNIILKRKDTSPCSDCLGFEIARYRFKILEEAAHNIKVDLQTHCSKYLPFILIDELQLKRVGSEVILMGVSIINQETNKKKNILFKLTEDKSRMLVSLLK